MRDFVIVTDSSADLSEEMTQAFGLRTVQLGVLVEGETVQANNAVDIQKIYTQLREKKRATTSAVSIDSFLDLFREILAENVDILYLGFSSGLSGTFGAGAVALRELSEEYPDRKLYAVDTLCASMGQGLLVYYAVMMKRGGADIDTVKNFVEETKLQLCHWFTVDDLFFLKRGGRISAATAVAGTLLGIKPVMHVDNEGRLVKVTTARGRRASIDALLERMKKTMLPDRNEVVFISHGDCLADAEYLAERIKQETNVSEVVINYVGPVIGSHSGPGTLALFFLGTER